MLLDYKGNQLPSLKRSDLWRDLRRRVIRCRSHTSVTESNTTSQHLGDRSKDKTHCIDAAHDHTEPDIFIRHSAPRDIVSQQKTSNYGSMFHNKFSHEFPNTTKSGQCSGNKDQSASLRQTVSSPKLTNPRVTKPSGFSCVSVRLDTFMKQLSKSWSTRLLLLAVQLPYSTDLQICLCQEMVKWTRSEKHTFLRQRVKARVTALLMDSKEYSESWTLLLSLVKENSRVVYSLKYMLLCKIMVNQADDVAGIISSKALKFFGPEFDAMNAVVDAYAKRSLKLFETALQDFKGQLDEDLIVHRHC